MKIKRIALLLALMLIALAIPIWASVGEDYQDQGLPDRSREIITITDGCDANDDAYECDDYTPGQDYTVPVSVVNVSSTSVGLTQITIPGHADVCFMAFSTEYDIEFFVSPPEGTHFSPETALQVSGGIHITFGPVVRGCGRLFFVMSVNPTDNDNEAQMVDIIFDAGPGHMPLGESGSLRGPVGLLVESAPTPYSVWGYNFVGWEHNGIRVNFPFHAAANMTLEAVYELIPPNTVAQATFTLTLRPTGGTLPAGEPLSRSLPINTTLSELPTPIREGHFFGGWLAGSGLATLPVTLTSDTELTAVWARMPQPQANTTAESGESSPATQADTLTAIFDPNPGTFATGESGLRIGPYGTNINNIPTPLLSGYIFIDWRLPNGHSLNNGNLSLREDIRLTAIWLADATVTPAPTPSPTPAPGNPGTLPNPQTNPVQISITIFGAVLIAGISALGIMKISRKQMAAAGDYRSKVARYNREKRIMDLMDE